MGFPLTLQPFCLTISIIVDIRGWATSVAVKPAVPFLPLTDWRKISCVRKPKNFWKKTISGKPCFPPDFQSVLTDMVVYLRASRLPFSLQEQVRRDITDMFLAGQEKGASPSEIIGMDYKEYCDKLLQGLPQNNRRTQMLCTFRDISLVLCVGIAVLFLPELLGALLSHRSFLTLTLGKLIFLVALVTFAYALVENICKNAFTPTEKQNALIKNMHFLWLFVGFILLFFLKKPAWEIPFFIPLLVCVALLLCYGLLDHFLG